MTTEATKDLTAARVALLVPESARDNYRRLFADQAKQTGKDVAAVAADYIAGWRKQEETDPLANTGILADWADSVDDWDVTGDPSPSDVARVKGEINVKMEGYSKFPVDLTDEQKADIDRYRDAVNGELPVVQPTPVDQPEPAPHKPVQASTTTTTAKSGK